MREKKKRVKRYSFPCQENYTDRQKAKGFVKATVWIPKDCKPELSAFGRDLRQKHLARTGQEDAQNDSELAPA